MSSLWIVNLWQVGKMTWRNQRVKFLVVAMIMRVKRKTHQDLSMPLNRLEWKPQFFCIQNRNAFCVVRKLSRLHRTTTVKNTKRPIANETSRKRYRRIWARSTRRLQKSRTSRGKRSQAAGVNQVWTWKSSQETCVSACVWGFGESFIHMAHVQGDKLNRVTFPSNLQYWIGFFFRTCGFQIVKPNGKLM